MAKDTVAAGWPHSLWTCGPFLLISSLLWANVFEQTVVIFDPSNGDIWRVDTTVLKRTMEWQHGFVVILETWPRMRSSLQTVEQH